MQKDERKIAVMNPYDAIGKAHNKGLDFVVEKLNPQEEIKHERIVELVSQYLVSLRTNDEHKDGCTDMKEDFIFGYVGVGKTMNIVSKYSLEELMVKGEFTAKQKCFLEAILNVSEERDLDREGTLKILLNIEEQILASDLTPKELEVPLIVVSVAKYSVKYFMEQMNNDESEWKNFINGDLSNFRWPWKKDGKGAIGGALGGVTGGVGGVILGAIGGALGNSIAAALGLT
jgi:hypothetical protein